MDYSDDFHCTNLLHVPTNRSFQTRQEGLYDQDYLFHHAEPSTTHFSREGRQMRDIINRSSQSAVSTLASIFSAQHQTSNLYGPSPIPLLNPPYTMLLKENDFLQAASCYSPRVSSTSSHSCPSIHSLSSMTAILGSPFAPKPLAPLSTPVKHDSNTDTEHFSPATHLSDGSSAFYKAMDTVDSLLNIRNFSDGSVAFYNAMNSMDSPFKNSSIPSWTSSDPDLSPVIRAPPASSLSYPYQSPPKTKISFMVSDENRPPTSVQAVPATPKRSLRQSSAAPVSSSSRSSPNTKTLFNVDSIRTSSTCLTLSPLSPLTPSQSPQPPQRQKRKRQLLKKGHEEDEASPSSSPVPSKKRRVQRPKAREPNLSSQKTQVPDVTLGYHYTIRSFPDIEVSLDFPLFYRRYPLSSYLQLEGAESPCTLFGVKHPGGIYNPPRSPFDLYTPRFVQGKGAEKVGLCPICIESHSRGGEDKALWLAMKFSALK
ncbi:hypothetical protein F5887DRAFT_47689 [Amanita rubescens]|nr:hypothetical protein F5887DRAFT_47689 [Amanita rubescens]